MEEGYIYGIAWDTKAWNSMELQTRIICALPKIAQRRAVDGHMAKEAVQLHSADLVPPSGEQSHS